MSKSQSDYAKMLLAFKVIVEALQPFSKEVQHRILNAASIMASPKENVEPND